MKRSYNDIDNSVDQSDSQPSEKTAGGDAQTDPEGPANQNLSTVTAAAAVSTVASITRRKCPYLDTVNRQYLDFDNEKLCSITLSNLNVYACLVCGKFFQGRGKSTPAYTHSVQVNHFVFINLHDSRVYCLPDAYEVVDSSLEDIKRCLSPKFTSDERLHLDQNASLARDVYGVAYLPGFVGLNNLKCTDYINVMLHALGHVTPLRNFFLAPELYQESKSTLVHSFGTVLRKMWSSSNFKSVVSPQEIVQEISLLSNKRFSIGARSEVIDVLAWLLQELHRGLGGTKKPRSSVIGEAFQGEVDVAVYKKKAASSSNNDESDLQDYDVTVSNTPFMYLSLDIPPCPLFRDSQGGLVVPQIPLFEVLKKFDGSTLTDHVSAQAGHTRRKYTLRSLPRYLILHLNRFTKNNFFMEKNPTIVTFPVKNLEMRDYVHPSDDVARRPALPGDVPGEEAGLSVEQVRALVDAWGSEADRRRANASGGNEAALRAVCKDVVRRAKVAMATKYDLVANICHDSHQASQSVSVGGAGGALSATSGSNKSSNSNNSGNNSGSNSNSGGSGGSGNVLADGSYRVHLLNKATQQWYELQDLHVVETMPQLVGLSESYLLVYEKKRQL